MDARELADMLDGVDVDWCVVGGWAIDLFLGEVTRPHHDLEIAVQREDLAAIHGHLSGFVFFAVGDGAVRRLEPDEAGPLDRRQHWVLDEQAGAWRVDVMVEPGDSRWWVFRRDERVRSLPRRDGAAQPATGFPISDPRARSLQGESGTPRKTRRTSMRRARSCHSRTERGSLMRCDWSIPDTPGSLASTRRTASSRDRSTGRRDG